MPDPFLRTCVVHLHEGHHRLHRFASNTGGEVTTWGINATLPSGLSFGTSNGRLGHAGHGHANHNLHVYANNSQDVFDDGHVHGERPSEFRLHQRRKLHSSTYSMFIKPVTPITFSGGGLPTSCAPPSLRRAYS